MVKLNYASIKRLLNVKVVKNRPILQCLHYRDNNIIEYCNSYMAVQVYDNVKRDKSILINIHTLQQHDPGATYPSIDRVLNYYDLDVVNDIQIVNDTINGKDTLLYKVNNDGYFDKKDVDLLFKSVGLKFNSNNHDNLYYSNRRLMYKTDAIKLLQLGLVKND